MLFTKLYKGIYVKKKKKKKKKIFLPTYPIFFGHVTLNTALFFFGLIQNEPGNKNHLLIKTALFQSQGQSYNTGFTVQSLRPCKLRLFYATYSRLVISIEDNTYFISVHLREALKFSEGGQGERPRAFFVPCKYK